MSCLLFQRTMRKCNLLHESPARSLPLFHIFHTLLLIFIALGNIYKQSWLRFIYILSLSSFTFYFYKHSYFCTNNFTIMIHCVDFFLQNLLWEIKNFNHLKMSQASKLIPCVLMVNRCRFSFQTRLLFFVVCFFLCDHSNVTQLCCTEGEMRGQTEYGALSNYLPSHYKPDIDVTRHFACLWNWYCEFQI